MLLKLIDMTISGIILSFILFVGSRIQTILGGSLTLLIMIPCFYYFSYIEKRAKLEATLFSILLLAVLIINYLNYLAIFEMVDVKTIAIIYCVLHLIIILLFAIMILVNVELSKDGNSKDLCGIIRQNFQLLITNNVGFSLIYAIVSGMCFIIVFEDKKSSGDLLQVVPISFMWIPIVFASLLLNKYSKYEYLDCIFKKNSKPFASDNYTRYFYIIICFVFIIGSLIESSRSEWLLWIESFISINLFVIWSWKIHKSRICTKKGLDIPENIKSFISFEKFIIIVGFHALIMTMYVIVLVLVLLENG